MLWKGFQRPKRLEFERETLTDRFGRFYAQPFERGFGTTVGNALRRVLLSSIEGAAITAIRVEGVLHEFSPIPGAMEDTTDLILNLKRVPLKMHVYDRFAWKPEHSRKAREFYGADVENVEEALRGVVVVTGAKPKDVFQPIRVAVAGTTISPGIFESVVALGKDEALTRIDDALVRAREQG